MKIAVITCYFLPDYVRARTLRATLKTMPGVHVVIVKNKHTGLLRYPEILWKIWQVKRHQAPDAYLITFRGYEILPFVLWMAGKKPVIFDEFIIPILHATNEKHIRTASMMVKHFLSRVGEPMYRRWLRRCKAILADTQVHAELSARVQRLNLSKYVAVPVGADEKLFKPVWAYQTNDIFRIFYYSLGMQPLHGIPIVLEAAEKLKDADVEFIMVGGKKPMERAVKAAQARGANIRYERWVPFENLVDAIQSSALCLGGPFGDTQQAHHVVTGKTYQFLACAAPVLVGNSEATDEYFKDKENALVVPQGDAEALARAIRWAQKHPAELAGIAKSGRKLYEKEFSTPALARRLQPLVDALVS